MSIILSIIAGMANPGIIGSSVICAVMKGSCSMELRMTYGVVSLVTIVVNTIATWSDAIELGSLGYRIESK